MIKLAEYPHIRVHWLVRDSKGEFLMYLNASWLDLEDLRTAFEFTVDEVCGVIHLD